MNQIWHVSSKQISSHNLWRDEKGVFWIVMFGNFNPILTGRDYTIVHRSLLPAFDLLLSDKLEIEPIVIKRRATEQEWTDYYELIIKQHISPTNLQSIDSFGEQVWQFNHYPMVSGNLKLKLEKLKPKELSFSPGFQDFYGDSIE